MKKICCLMTSLVMALVLLVIGVGALDVGQSESYATESVVNQLFAAYNSEVTNPGDEAADVVIAKDGKSDYKIIYSKSETGASGKAFELSEFFYANCRKADIPTAADTVAESKKEILWGKTNRQLSIDLIAAVEETIGEEETFVWAFACRDGQFAVYTEGGGYALEQFWTSLAELVKEEALVLKDGFMSINYKTKAEYDREQQEEADRLEEEKKQKRLEKALEVYNSHKGSNEFKTQLVFNKGEVVDRILHEEGAELMPTDAFDYPPYTPTMGEHPRLLVKKEMVPEILRLLADERFSKVSAEFWKYANASGVTGIIPATGTVTHKNGTPNDPSDDYTYEVHNSTTIMFQIEAKALAYVLTGDVVYAYEAIGALKNAILTERYWTSTQQDTYHGYQMVIEISAYVYDWCYDVMTEEDKEQIIDGIRFYLCPYIEFKYPPSNMGYVSGHGTGTQMFRGWINLAAAMADERPDWWAYVAGRFYQYYIPVVDQMYSSGFLSQGTNYGPGKYSGQLFAAYMLETMGDTDAMGTGISRKTPYYILSMIMPNGHFFQTGDATNGSGHMPDGQSFIEWNWMVTAAALTEDPVILSWAYKYSVAASQYGTFDWSMGEHITPAIYAILAANCENWEQLGEVDFSIGLIQYNGFPGGQVTIRNRWSEDAVAMFMKVTDRTMANHDHRDSGSFQIYYKGLLACDSGFYTGVSYGSDHSKYYQQATVAHNGLLVYDPVKATDKFYSGGQIRLNEASTIPQWNSGKYDLAKIIGHAEGYSQDGTQAEYAYIAGDMTNSYDSDSVNYIARHMISIMQNDNSSIPMVMFVYDDIESDNTEAIKKFLLHTVNEPSIDENTNVVTAIEKEGKLTLVPLYGVEKVEKIGGEGKEYWVGKDAENGYNVIDGIEAYDPKNSPYGSSFMWGRVELSATGESTNRMLNMIFVTGANSSARVDATLIDTEAVLGAEIDGSVVAFLKARERHSAEFTITSEGDGLIDYYFAGLREGVWQVSCDGKVLGTTYSGAGQNFVKFTAPAGEITLTPYKVEVRHEINYNTYDAVLPAGTAKKYVEGVGLAELPTPVHPHGDFVFDGWYDNPEFAGEVVTSIPADSVGTVNLYAKWNGSRINYELGDGLMPDGYAQHYVHGVGVSAFDVPSHPQGYEFLGWYADATYKTPVSSISADSVGEVTVYAKWNKPPSVYADYESGEKDSLLSGALSPSTVNGKNMLKWSTSKEGPIITIKTTGEHYSVMYGDEIAVSYTFSIAKVNGTKIIKSYCRLVNKSSKELRLFYVHEDGRVTLGNSTEVIFTLTEELQTMRLVLSFETGKLTAYNEEGFPIMEVDAQLPSGYKSFEEYRQSFTTDASLINWRANDEGALHIGGISIKEGNTHISELAKISNMVTYNPNGGVIEGEYEKFFRPGFGIDTLPTPTHPNGFEFLGWYENPDFSGEAVTSISGDLGRNLFLYAKWGGSKVIYETVDGILPEGYIDFFFHGEGLSELPTPTHPYGFAFLGWYYNEDYSGERVTDIGADVTADVTLYAKWGGAYITFNPSKGTLPDEVPEYYIYGVGIDTLPAPTHPDGYSFIGWYLDVAYTTPVDKISADATGNITLYAKWNKPPSVYANYDGSVTGDGKLEGAFTKAEINGDAAYKWTTVKDGPIVTIKNVGESYSVMYGDKRAVSFTVSLAKDATEQILSCRARIIAPGNKEVGIFSVDKDGKVTLGSSTGPELFVLTEELQTVRIVLDFETEKLYAYNEEGFPISEVAAKKPSGYATLEDWRLTLDETVAIINVRAESAGAIYIGDLVIEEGNTLVSEEALSVRLITYETDGGTMPENAPSYYMAGTGISELPKPTHSAGYKFLGWYGNANFEGDAIKAISAESDKNVTLYAKWEKCNVNYVTNGGKLPSDAPLTFAPGVGIEKLPVPEAPEGCTFVGWYLDSAYTAPVTSIGADVTTDVTVYAKWTGKPIVYLETDGTEKGNVTASFRPPFNGIFDAVDTDGDSAPDAIEWSITDGGGETVMPNLATGAHLFGYNTMFGDEASVSITTAVSSIPGYGALNTSFRIGGTAVGSTVSIFHISNGVVKLAGGKVAIATLGEEMSTIRVKIDFTNANLVAYDKDGYVLETVGFSVPKINGVSYTAEEWRQMYTESVNLLNWRINSHDGSLNEDGSTRRYGMYIGELKIEEGDVYKNENTDKGKAINYECDGGSVSASAPTYFVIGEGVEELPVPTHPNGYVFLGWYDNAEFMGEKIESIGKEATEPVTLYARWGKSSIEYALNGGTLPDDAPDFFMHGVGVATLPTPTHPEGLNFVGWYGDASFTTPVEAIGTDVTSDVTLYAKWKGDPIVYLNNDGASTNGISSSFRSKFNGIFKAVDTNGDSNPDVIEWSITDGDGETTMPTLGTGEHPYGYNTMYGDEAAVSITTSVGAIPGYGALNTSFRIGGSAIGSTVSIFHISNGVVKLAGGKVAIATLGEEMSTIRVKIDFANANLVAYDKDGYVLETVGFSAPKIDNVSYTPEEWRQLYTESINLLNWRINSHDGSANEDGSTRRYGMYIGKLKIQEGDAFKNANTDSVKSISYETFGGDLPEDAPTSFKIGEGIAALPVPTHPEGYNFVGWYADASFTSPRSSISASEDSDVTLYAKWQAPPVLYFDTDGSSRDGITANFKPGFEGVFAPVDTDADSAPDAIEWSINGFEFAEGERVVMPNLSIEKDTVYNTMSGDEHAVSFTVELASISGYGNLSTTFRFGGSAIGGTVEIFKTDGSGNVKLKNGNKVICTLGEEMQTLRIVFDFDNEKIYAYDANGELIDTANTGKPSNFTGENLEQWRQGYTSNVSLINWYLGGRGGSAERYGMYIGGLRIEEGNVFAD